MFYEERIINGALCSRSTPDGEFVPMSAERLTTLVLELRQRMQTVNVLPSAPVAPTWPMLVPMPQPHWVQPGFVPPYIVTCCVMGRKLEPVGCGDGNTYVG